MRQVGSITVALTEARKEEIYRNATLARAFGVEVNEISPDVGKSVALGMLRADLAVPGTVVEVEIYGERFPALVQKDEPLWDPANERIRA